MYDTCNAEKSDVALCSVLSTYSRDCATAGVSLKGWRLGICGMHSKILWVGIWGNSFRRACGTVCGSQYLLCLVIKLVAL